MSYVRFGQEENGINSDIYVYRSVDNMYIVSIAANQIDHAALKTKAVRATRDINDFNEGISLDEINFKPINLPYAGLTKVFKTEEETLRNIIHLKEVGYNILDSTISQFESLVANKIENKIKIL